LRPYNILQIGKINLDLNKTYTYADYLKWSFDEAIELIRGFVEKMATAPGLSHQIISRKLTIRMGLYFEYKSCQLFSAPFDVRLPLKKDEIKDVEITTVVPRFMCCLVLSAEKSVIIYTLNEAGIYIGSKPYTEEDTISSPQFSGMEIDLSYVFAD